MKSSVTYRLALLLLASLPLLAAEPRLVAAADGKSITWTGSQPATRNIALRLDPVNPAAAELTLRRLDDGTAAKVSIPAPRTGLLRTLTVPPGWYELSVTMPHHRDALRSFHAVAADLALGEIPLPPAPVISGVVRRAKGTPLAGVRVAAGEGSGAVTTKADGRFALEVTGKWPSELAVRAAGFGAKLVPVAATEASAELPAIVLARAGSIRITVERNAFDAPLEFSAGIPDEAGPTKWIAHKRLDKGNTLTFDDLDAGSYVILAAGPQPLERIAKRVNVGAGDRRDVAIPIHFLLAHGRLTMGGKPLARVAIRFDNSDNRWDTTVTTDDAGEISTPAWETGAFTLSIRGANMHAPIIRNVTLDGRGMADFKIDIPERRVRGRVVDVDGVPVANTLVSLRTQTETFAPTVRMITGPDGEFEFNGVYAGKQTLRLRPDAFLQPDPLSFPMAEGDRLHEETVTLKRGSDREVRVFGRDGNPVPRAAVVVASGDRIRASSVTDISGRARISAPSDGPSILYVFPKEGSLVARRLGSEESSVRIDVPPPNASIVIATLTTDGEAVPNVELLMRYNGEVLPPDVSHELERQQGLYFTTDQSGAAHLRHLPAGTYEFWPYRSEHEAELLLASASGFAAPIVVNAVTGENKVTVRFRKK
jgi:hypothetical protein